MITISKQYSFDSAHQLCHDPDDEEHTTCDRTFGKCARLHGHTYVLEVTVTGRELKNGMILNYFDLDEVVKPIVDGELDHRNLNDVFPEMLTTAENMVNVIGQNIRGKIESQYPDVRLYSVRLSETPKTTAVWTP